MSADTGSATRQSALITLSPRALKLKEVLHNFVEYECIPAEKLFHVQMGKMGTEDRWKIVPPVIEHLKSRAKSLGLWNLFLPNYYPESPGLTNLEYAVLCEIMGRTHLAAEACNCSAPDTGNMEVFARYGSPAQKKKWLEPLLNGTIRSAFAMTEPAVASSDATNIETRIEKKGDHYLINGRKWWISGAGDPRCKVYLLMGKSDFGAEKHRQQSVVIVPADAPGITVVRPLTVFGYDDAPHGHCEIIFKDVRVPLDNMVLGEGRGFEIIQGRLGPGRIHHCMRSIGMAERALEYHLLRATDPARKTFGKVLAAHGSASDSIALSRMEIDQARLLVLQAADTMDRLGPKAAMHHIALAKVVVPSAVLRVIDRAIQAHGAGGVGPDVPLAYFYAQMRTLRIADGPDEVHMRQIGKVELQRASELRAMLEKKIAVEGKFLRDGAKLTTAEGDSTKVAVGVSVEASAVVEQLRGRARDIEAELQAVQIQIQDIEKQLRKLKKPSLLSIRTLLAGNHAQLLSDQTKQLKILRRKAAEITITHRAAVNVLEKRKKDMSALEPHVDQLRKLRIELSSHLFRIFADEKRDISARNWVMELLETMNARRDALLNHEMGLSEVQTARAKLAAVMEEAEVYLDWLDGKETSGIEIVDVGGWSSSVRKVVNDVVKCMHRAGTLAPELPAFVAKFEPQDLNSVVGGVGERKRAYVDNLVGKVRDRLGHVETCEGFLADVVKFLSGVVEGYERQLEVAVVGMGKRRLEVVEMLISSGRVVGGGFRLAASAAGEVLLEEPPAYAEGGGHGASPIPICVVDSSETIASDAADSEASEPVIEQQPSTGILTSASSSTTLVDLASNATFPQQADSIVLKTPIPQVLPHSSDPSTLQETETSNNPTPKQNAEEIVDAPTPTINENEDEITTDLIRPLPIEKIVGESGDDFEATCDSPKNVSPLEIIEFPIVLLDATLANCPAVAEFHHYVKPVKNPKLSAFCTELTGIEQKTVDAGIPFNEVFKNLEVFITSHGLTKDNTIVITCGDWDLKTMFPIQLSVTGIPATPELFQQWCNLKKAFADFKKKPATGMAGMLTTLGLPLVGRHHSGIDDARNIANVARTLVAQGCLIEVTTTVQPKKPKQPKADGAAVAATATTRTIPGEPPGKNVVKIPSQPKKKNNTPKQPPPPVPDCGPIIDIGANLTHKPFNKETLPSYLKRARKEAGVRHIILTGTSIKGSQEAIQVCREYNSAPNAAEDYPHLTCTVGVHPHDSGRHCEGEGDWVSTLQTLISSNRDIVVAVGECGLDFDRNFSTPAHQILAFEKQIELALKLDLPLFLHERSAHEKFVEIYERYNKKGNLRGVLHCYTGETEGHLEKCLQLGLHIGITGWVTDMRPGRGEGLASIVPKIPLERLMVETDAPFLTPRNLKPLPKVNEPALLGWVVKGVGECFGMDVKEIGRISTKNAVEFFKLPAI
ncbi:hypothetical protein HDV05_007589 [Chytridiales sp. JEL 0842]|nr:hypothetical protein HDV05_007589 [Chytridiales sp. JEL 0842]